MFPRNRKKAATAFFSLLLICTFMFGAGQAQAAGRLDGSFNPAVENFLRTVTAVAVQADQKIVIVGNFNVVNGVSRNFVARLNTDGSLDTSFNPGIGANASVFTVAVQADQKIIIGGAFTTVNGVPCNRLARLNTDGSVDTSFDTSLGVNNLVRAVVVQSDQKIIIGGDFTSVDGVPRNRIARLNTDATIDVPFDPGAGANVTVLAVAVQADQKIVIGGSFTTINGTSRNRIARLTTLGALDATFDPGTGANSTVTSLAIQSDQQVVIGGLFTSVNGTTRSRVARLSPFGVLDTSFDTSVGADSFVNAVTVQSDQKIVIGGAFLNMNGTPRARIARLNTNGSLDTSFDPGTGADNTVNGIAIQADQKVVIVGTFTIVNNVARIFVARLNTNGSVDTSFTPAMGTNGTVAGIAVQADQKIVIVGDFTTVNGVARSRVARLNPDGSLDTSFNPGTGANNTTLAVAVQADQKILIGGSFTTVNGVARNRIARLNTDGSVDDSFDTSIGANATVRAIALQADQKVVIGGDFTSVNSVTRNFAARLTLFGSLDTSFDTSVGPNNTVLTVAVESDQKVIIGGAFTFVNNVPRNRIARLNSDASLDASFDPGNGADSTVRSVAVQADQKVIVGGSFTTINNVPRNRVARLNTDGSLDTSFDTSVGADGAVLAVAVQADQKIIIAGTLTTINGVARKSVARLNTDGSVDTSFNPGRGTDFSVGAIALQADKKIVIGGSFVTVNGITHFGLARLLGAGGFPADFDADSRTEVAVWNPNNHNWYIIDSSTGNIRLPVEWGSGALGDVAVPGDYDGDAKTDIAVWRPSEGNFYIIKSSDGSGFARNWGANGDVPVPADYDGDGKTDIAVFRPSEGNWYIINSATNAVTVRSWGASADKPVPGDYDGDGRIDIAVYRPSEGNWYIINSSTNAITIKQWGNSTDKLVPADYDGDGKTDIAVWRGSEGNWYIINSATNIVTIKGWGASSIGDKPVPGDYDGDGGADIAVFREPEGNWYIINSKDNTVRVVNLGGSGDVPVPSAYLPQ